MTFTNEWRRGLIPSRDSLISEQKYQGQLEGILKEEQAYFLMASQWQK